MKLSARRQPQRGRHLCRTETPKNPSSVGAAYFAPDGAGDFCLPHYNDAAPTALPKPIPVEIDREPTGHYGFTAAELDFILNYDTRLRLASARQVNYRLGRDTETEEE